MNVVHVGVDAVHIPRMARMIAVSPHVYVPRAWTPHERAWCGTNASRLAARWAAKEAVMKALGQGLDFIDPLHIEVLSEDGAPPRLALTSNAQERADALGIDNWSLSITHEHDLAVAFVIGFGAHE